MPTKCIFQFQEFQFQETISIWILVIRHPSTLILTLIFAEPKIYHHYYGFVSLFQRNNLMFCNWVSFQQRIILEQVTNSKVTTRCGREDPIINLVARRPTFIKTTPPSSHFNKSCKFQLLQTGLKANWHGPLINFLDDCHQICLLWLIPFHNTSKPYMIYVIFSPHTHTHTHSNRVWVILCFGYLSNSFILFSNGFVIFVEFVFSWWSSHHSDHMFQVFIRLSWELGLLTCCVFQQHVWLS